MARQRRLGIGDWRDGLQEAVLTEGERGCRIPQGGKATPLERVARKCSTPRRSSMASAPRGGCGPARPAVFSEARSASCAVVTSNPIRRNAAAMSAASFSGFGNRAMWE